MTSHRSRACLGSILLCLIDLNLDRQGLQRLYVGLPRPVVDQCQCTLAPLLGLEAQDLYAAGTNHVLPTNGTARRYSMLNTLDFLKFMSIVRANDDSLCNIGPVVARLAREEGLEAHARAIEERLGNQGKIKQDQAKKAGE